MIQKPRAARLLVEMMVVVVALSLLVFRVRLAAAVGCMAAFQVTSDPAEAYVYNNFGEYLGKTPVFYEQWLSTPGEGPRRISASFVFRKRGYKETKQEVQFSCPNTGAYVYVPILGVLEGGVE